MDKAKVGIGLCHRHKIQVGSDEHFEVVEGRGHFATVATCLHGKAMWTQFQSAVPIPAVGVVALAGGFAVQVLGYPDIGRVLAIGESSRVFVDEAYVVW